MTRTRAVGGCVLAGRRGALRRQTLDDVDTDADADPGAESPVPVHALIARVILHLLLRGNPYTARDKK